MEERKENISIPLSYSLCQQDFSSCVSQNFLILTFPCIESRWARDVQNPPRPILGQTQPPPQCVPSLFLRVNWLSHGDDH